MSVGDSHHVSVPGSNALSGHYLHFAVTPAQEKQLLAAKSDRKLLELVGEIEEAWEEPFVVETDKAWDAIRRCLTDGSLLYVSGDQEV